MPVQRVLSGEGRQGDAARQRQDAPAAFPNGITLSPDEKYLYVTAGGRRHDALRHPARRHGDQRPRVRRSTAPTGCGSTARATSTRPAAGRPGRYPDHVAGRQAARPAASAAAGRRAPGARVRHQRRVRRRRQSRALHHRVHARVQDAPQAARRAPGPEKVKRGRHEKRSGITRGSVDRVRRNDVSRGPGARTSPCGPGSWSRRTWSDGAADAWRRSGPGVEAVQHHASDPGLDAIIDPNAKIETLASGFGINEGVLWVPEGKSGYCWCAA